MSGTTQIYTYFNLGGITQIGQGICQKSLFLHETEPTVYLLVLLTPKFMLSLYSTITQQGAPKPKFFFQTLITCQIYHHIVLVLWYLPHTKRLPHPAPRTLHKSQSISSFPCAKEWLLLKHAKQQGGGGYLAHPNLPQTTARLNRSIRKAFKDGIRSE